MKLRVEVERNVEQERSVCGGALTIYGPYPFNVVSTEVFKGAQILKKGHRGRFFYFTNFYWTNYLT